MNAATLKIHHMQAYRYLLSIILLLDSASCTAIESNKSAAPQPDTPTQTTSNDAIDIDSSVWAGTVQEVLISALGLIGIQYKYGGSSPETGFDCSGFVHYVFFEAANLSLPHSSRAMSQLGQVIPREQLEPGDLVFFNTLKSTFSHVGIYLGSSRFIHAPSAGGSISIVNMNDAYWVKHFNGARRLELNGAAFSDKSSN